MSGYSAEPVSPAHLWRFLDPARMDRLWRGLVSQGIRAMGTPGAERAVDYITRSLDGLDLGVERHTFTYPGWRLPVPVKLAVVAPEARPLEAEAFLRSGPTPPGGLRARVTADRPAAQRIWGMYTWDRWRLVGEKDDDRSPEVGYLSGRPSGPAIPQLLPERSAGLPHFIIGEHDAAIVRGWQEADVDILLEGNLESVHAEEATGTSVSAKWVPPGTPLDSAEIVICAHYDTVYNSAGAYDNASGCGMLLEIAHLLAGLDARQAQRLPPVRLVWFGAEELGLEGSLAYVRERKEKGTFKRIAAVLNLDGFGRNDPLELWAGPEAFADAVYAIAQEAGQKWEPAIIPGGPDAERLAGTAPELYVVFPPPPGSDHTSFYDRGLPVVMLTFNDQEIIHSLADECAPEMLANMVRGARIALSLLPNLVSLAKLG